jgi:hypothetical protein
VGEEVLGAAGVCGPCVSLGVFLLLYWRMTVSGNSGGLCCVQMVQ